MVSYKKKYLKYKLKYEKINKSIVYKLTAGTNDFFELGSLNFLSNENKILINYDINKFLKLNDGKIILIDNFGNQDIIFNLQENHDYKINSSNELNIEDACKNLYDFFINLFLINFRENISITNEEIKTLLKYDDEFKQLCTLFINSKPSYEHIQQYLEKKNINNIENKSNTTNRFRMHTSLISKIIQNLNRYWLTDLQLILPYYETISIPIRYTKLQQYINKQQLPTFIASRQLFYKTISKKYNKKYNEDNLPLPDLFITGRILLGKGDIMTQYKMYELCKKFFRSYKSIIDGQQYVKVYVIYLDCDKLKTVLYKTTEGYIHKEYKNEKYETYTHIINSNDINDNIYCCKAMYLNSTISQLTKNDKFIINTPCCPDFIYNNITIWEYGTFNEINIDSFGSGLLPTEIGIYITDIKEIPVLDLINPYLLYTSVNSTENIRKFFKYFTYYLFNIIELTKLDKLSVINLFIPGFKHTITDLGTVYQELLQDVSFQKTQFFIEMQIFYSKIDLTKAILDENDIIKTMFYNDDEFEIEINIHKQILSSSQFIQVSNSTNHLVGCSGDQSISEMLSLNKLPYYEYTAHKNTFYNSLQLLSRNLKLEHLSEYLDIHYTIFVDQDENIEDSLIRYTEIIKQVLHSNEHITFCEFIKNNLNINNTLPGVLKMLLISKYNNELYLDECRLFNNMLLDTNKYNDWCDFFDS